MYKIVIRNALITFLSRVLGFTRDILMAKYIGASWQLDAFLIVFKLPNFFRRLFAEGVFSQTLLPLVMQAKDKKAFLEHVYAIYIVIVLIVTLPFVLYPEVMLSVFAHGLDPNHQTFLKAVELLPWVFPYLGCMACCGFYVVQLNIHRQYEVGSMLPIALNVMLLSGIYGYSQYFLIDYVAKSVFIAGIIQVLFCVYRVYQIQGVIWPCFRHEYHGISKLFKQAFYGFLAQVITYVSSCLDLFLVSFLVTGSLSWLYYAERLAYLPLGVISVVLANIVLTDLSQACKNQDEDKMTAILQKASKWVLLFSLPSMIGGFFLSEIIVATLFKSDNFTIYDVSACATAFQLLSLAIPFLMFVRVWNVVPYALSKPQELLKITMISFVMSSSITLILLPKFQYLAICVGILFGGVSNACQLYYYVQKIINEPLFDAAFVKNSIYASLAMASVLLLMNILFPTSIIEDKWTLLYNLFFRSLLSLSAWFLCLRTDQIRMLKD